MSRNKRPQKPLKLDAALLFPTKNATMLWEKPAALRVSPLCLSVCLSVCLSAQGYGWSGPRNARWEQRPHAQKQNKLRGKEVVNINKDPIRRLNVKRWLW